VVKAFVCPRMSAFLATALLACTPELEDRASLLTEPRVLAIRATPAEEAPTKEVSLDALYVGPTGELATNGLSWAFCVARKPLTELGSVAPSCLEPAGEGVLPIGSGSTGEGVLPDDACRLFGPDRPEPKDGEPAGRPVDADPSGGFYQPVRVGLDGTFVTGAVRIRCGLSGANPEQAATFREAYRSNVSPAPNPLSLRRGNGLTEVLPGDATSAPPTVSPGEDVAIVASWPDCSADESCGGAESYLWFNPEKRTLTVRREAIRVSWFVTAGSFDVDRTGRAEEEANTPSSENGWKAPSGAEDVWMWAVLRDDRGGVGWKAGRVRVAP